MELKVFVYGTLKPGQARHQYYSDQVVSIRTAIAQGQLFALPAGYPAMTLGQGWVHGFVLSFNDHSILYELDAYEDYQAGREPYQNLYERCLIETFDLAGRLSYGDAPRFRQGGHERRSLAVGKSLGSAWAYMMTQSRVQQMGGVCLPDGEWP